MSKKPYSDTSDFTIRWVPNPLVEMFETVLRVQSKHAGKTQLEYLTDMFMREAEDMLGKEEAHRMMGVYERGERQLKGWYQSEQKRKYGDLGNDIK